MEHGDEGGDDEGDVGPEPARVASPKKGEGTKEKASRRGEGIFDVGDVALAGAEKPGKEGEESGSSDEGDEAVDEGLRRQEGFCSQRQ